MPHLSHVLREPDEFVVVAKDASKSTPCVGAAALLADGLGGIQQRFVDVLGGEVGMLGEDLFGSRAVREHRRYRRDWEAQAADAGLAAHDGGVRGDPFVGH